MPEIDKAAKLVIDGKTYSIGYNFNDLVDAETVCGCNLYDAMGRLGRDITAGQLRGLLYAMVAPFWDTEKVNQPAALKLVGALIRPDTRSDIIMAIGEAFARGSAEALAERWLKQMTEVSDNDVEQQEIDAVAQAVVQAIPQTIV